ncbi:DUF4145 domain-containing protein [Gimesia aquarii]|uniref:DUF4145 domain-containing protein n=1 Tax=Gimesia aquarii TaxID=2527964 RepID=A0A517WWR3_9PLAN|nr:DUF4145 domain-containing protein [Gimesia aquarii]QDU09659.1 hypothetical protein V202x_30350 [Gimesia aquarii]
MNAREKVVKVRCSKCGRGYRNHLVLFETKKEYGDPDIGWTHDEFHQLIQCRGCDTFRYRRFNIELEYNPPEHRSDPYDIQIYPNDESESELRKPIQFKNNLEEEGSLVPENVWKMYRETIHCFNANARTMAGGGLRATVEAICLSQKINNGNLQKKIDELAKRNLLTTAQAELLHEERYIGNSALHEMTTPSSQDIEDGLEIVEGLINTIYILPSKAEALRKRRTTRGKSKINAKQSSSQKSNSHKQL